MPWESSCLSGNRVSVTTRIKISRNGSKCKSLRFKTIQNRHGLTHWGRVTHICVSKLSIIGSDNGLSPDRRQAIIWTNDGILLIGTLGTNFNEILIEIQTFSFKNILLKMSSGKLRPFCLSLNVLMVSANITIADSLCIWVYRWLGARLQYLQCVSLCKNFYLILILYKCPRTVQSFPCHLNFRPCEAIFKKRSHN